MSKIPETFSSVTEYKNSFIPGLLEETRSDLSSGLKDVSRASICEISAVERNSFFKVPKQCFYQIKLKRTTDEVKNAVPYEPQAGDIIAFTDNRPKSLDDLIAIKRKYNMLMFMGQKMKLLIRFLYYRQSAWREKFMNLEDIFMPSTFATLLPVFGSGMP